MEKNNPFIIETIRHSLAHIMALTIEQLFPRLNLALVQQLKMDFIMILIYQIVKKKHLIHKIC